MWDGLKDSAGDRSEAGYDGKGPLNCGTRMAVAKAHGNAVCFEIGRVAAIVQTVLHLRLATLFAHARDQSHEHGDGPGHPYNSEDHGGPALCPAPCGIANTPTGLAHVKCGAQTLSMSAPEKTMKLNAVATQIQYLVVALARRNDVSTHATEPTIEANNR